MSRKERLKWTNRKTHYARWIVETGRHHPQMMLRPRHGPSIVPSCGRFKVDSSFLAVIDGDPDKAQQFKERLLFVRRMLAQNPDEFFVLTFLSALGFAADQEGLEMK